MEKKTLIQFTDKILFEQEKFDPVKNIFVDKENVLLIYCITFDEFSFIGLT